MLLVLLVRRPANPHCSSAAVKHLPQRDPAGCCWWGAVLRRATLPGHRPRARACPCPAPVYRPWRELVPFPISFLAVFKLHDVGSFFQNMLTWDSLTEEVALTIGNITYAHSTCTGAHSGLEDADGMLQIRSGDRGATWSKAEYLDKKHLSGSLPAPTTGHGICRDNPATPPQYYGTYLWLVSTTPTMATASS